MLHTGIKRFPKKNIFYNRRVFIKGAKVSFYYGYPGRKLNYALLYQRVDKRSDCTRVLLPRKKHRILTYRRE